MATDIKAAVVTGAHNYDVVNFHRLFRELSGIDAYIQNLEDFVTDRDSGWEQYDVVVFFNYHQTTPGTLDDVNEAATRTILESLIDGPKGILLLHHAILCYPDWGKWQALSGVRREGTVKGAVDQKFRVNVLHNDHPITAGMDSWEMVDETYIKPDVDTEGSDILLSTDHVESMKTLGWTRERVSGRTFCLQSGHDNRTWTNPQFRIVLERGIKWTAGAL